MNLKTTVAFMEGMGRLWYKVSPCAFISSKLVISLFTETALIIPADNENNCN